MKVILTTEVKSLGKEGDIVDVARGYAQNYLIPRRLAVEAIKGNLTALEQKKRTQAARETQIKAEAEEIARRLQSEPIKLFAKAGKDNKLFGSITSSDIAQGIAKATGIDIDKHKIKLDENIKALGEYSVVVKISPNAEAKISLQVLKAVKSESPNTVGQ